jgi:hypothetical protein
VADLAADLGLDPNQALGALAAADLVHSDPASGTIGVAYPFSGRPTSHQVELAGGPTVSAMCALDALGIPQIPTSTSTPTPSTPRPTSRHTRA